MHRGKRLLILIGQEKWTEAHKRIKKHPKEARVWDEKEGILPIHLACWYADVPVKVIEALIDAYPKSLKLKTKKRSRLPIHDAVRLDSTINFEVVRVLLRYYRKGAAVLDYRGRTPLVSHLFYATKPCFKMVKMLTEAYPDAVCCCDNFKWYPLHYASGCANWKISQYLIELYPHSLQIKDNYGRTPRNVAEHNGEYEMSEKLYAEQISLFGSNITFEEDKINNLPCKNNTFESFETNVNDVTEDINLSGDTSPSSLSSISSLSRKTVSTINPLSPIEVPTGSCEDDSNQEWMKYITPLQSSTNNSESTDDPIYKCRTKNRCNILTNKYYTENVTANITDVIKPFEDKENIPPIPISDILSVKLLDNPVDQNVERLLRESSSDSSSTLDIIIDNVNIKTIMQDDLPESIHMEKETSSSEVDKFPSLKTSNVTKDDKNIIILTTPIIKVVEFKSTNDITIVRSNNSHGKENLISVKPEDSSVVSLKEQDNESKTTVSSHNSANINFIQKVDSSNLEDKNTSISISYMEQHQHRIHKCIHKETTCFSSLNDNPVESWKKNIVQENNILMRKFKDTVISVENTLDEITSHRNDHTFKNTLSRGIRDKLSVIINECENDVSPIHCKKLSFDSRTSDMIDNGNSNNIMQAQLPRQNTNSCYIKLQTKEGKETNRKDVNMSTPWWSRLYDDNKSSISPPRSIKKHTHRVVCSGVACDKNGKDAYVSTFIDPSQRKPMYKFAKTLEEVERFWDVQPTSCQKVLNRIIILEQKVFNKIRDGGLKKRLLSLKYVKEVGGVTWIEWLNDLECSLLEEKSSSSITERVQLLEQVMEGEIQMGSLSDRILSMNFI